MGSGFDLGAFLTGVSGGFASDAERKLLLKLDADRRAEEQARQDQLRSEDRDFGLRQLMAQLGVEDTSGDPFTAISSKVRAIEEQERSDKLAREQKIDLEKQQEIARGNISRQVLRLQNSVGKASFDNVFEATVKNMPPEFISEFSSDLQSLRASHQAELEANFGDVQLKLASMGLTAQEAQAILSDDEIYAGRELDDRFYSVRSAALRQQGEDRARANAEHRDDMLRKALAFVASGKSAEQANINFGPFPAREYEQLRASELSGLLFNEEDFSNAIEAGNAERQQGLSGNALSVEMGYGPGDLVDQVFNQFAQTPEIPHESRRRLLGRSFIWSNNEERFRRSVEDFGEVPGGEDVFVYRDKLSDLSAIRNGVNAIVAKKEAGEISSRSALKQFNAIVTPFEQDKAMFLTDPVKYTALYGVLPSSMESLYNSISSETYSLQSVREGLEEDAAKEPALQGLADVGTKVVDFLADPFGVGDN